MSSGKAMLRNPRVAEKEKSQLLRALPSVNDVLGWPEMKDVSDFPSHAVFVRAIRAAVQGEREKIRKGERKREPSRNELVSEIRNRVADLRRGSLRRVINGTGIVLHTNLGRAPLDPAAIERVAETARRYSNLEFELESGIRGERSDHLQGLLCELTGAEAAFVVNNNAGAVLLVLNTLAEGREVIVSRGELIEIGGSFRLPEVMTKSGAILREVGTTNRTYIEDYADAVGPETAVFLRAHPSNYRIEGFTAAPSRGELVALGKEKGIPVFEDLGSGLIVNLPEFEATGEPVASLVVRDGVDVVSFSGDKLLGGPQAGIIIGRKDLVKQIRRNPLTRALRIDKLTLAALGATLEIYRDEGIPPTLATLRVPLKELKNRARRLARKLRAADQSGKIQVAVREEESAAGGGSLPGITLPTMVVSIHHAGVSPEAISQAFRALEPPIIGRIREDRFLLDVRTILPEEIGEVARGFSGISFKG